MSAYPLNLEPKHILLLALTGLYAASKLIPRTPTRCKQIEPRDEHVLIVGASTGVGRDLAKMYVQRGAHVCLVARGEEKLREAEQECLSLLSGQQQDAQGRVLFVLADAGIVEDMVRVRDTILKEWSRLDTLAVVAGVSSLKPVLETAGVDGRSLHVEDATPAGLAEGVRIAKAAMQGNFEGPYLSAITFTPLLLRTSSSPSILLISSAAAVTAAPTRALYCASKSASTLLFQSLAIENPNLNLSVIFPSTIEGDFRASAVDAGPIRESDPNKKGLKRTHVARRCIEAVDWKERTVFMPAHWRLIPILNCTPLSTVITYFARKKYRYP